MKLARNFCNQHGWTDVDAAVSAACLGVIIAVNKFDPARKCRLTTYSRQWILNHLHHFFKQEREIIAIPSYLNTTKEKGHRYQAKADIIRKGVKSLKLESSIAQKDTSIDSFDKAEYDCYLEYELCEIMSILPIRERQVLISRFWQKQTYKEIGKQHGLSKQRIEQLQKQAIRTLRKVLKSYEYIKN